MHTARWRDHRHLSTAKPTASPDTPRPPRPHVAVAVAADLRQPMPMTRAMRQKVRVTFGGIQKDDGEFCLACKPHSFVLWRRPPSPDLPPHSPAHTPCSRAGARRSCAARSSSTTGESRQPSVCREHTPGTELDQSPEVPDRSKTLYQLQANSEPGRNKPIPGPSNLRAGVRSQPTPTPRPLNKQLAVRCVPVESCVRSVGCRCLVLPKSRRVIGAGGAKKAPHRPEPSERAP